jgi:two-component system chemotaxis response regulator CheB
VTLSVAFPAVPVKPVRADDDIRVVVVDDAIVVRSLLTRWIEEVPGLRLVGAFRDGQEAVDRIGDLKPDVVVLDVEMPNLDGISALPLLLKKKRDLVVIMASALTREHAEITLKALALGAADYVPKPDAEGAIMTSANFQRELIEKILALGARRPRAAAPSPRRPMAGPATRRLAGAIQKTVKWRVPEAEETPSYSLRPFSETTPRVLLIGASTGGPQALHRLIGRLDPIVDSAPILITQHMPMTFTAILAEHLARASARPVHEAMDGEPVLAGSIYLAPGGRHMQVARHDGTAVIALDDGPPINFCKPAIDPLFSSAAEVWGDWTMAVILTGMGNDGTHGAADIAASGGSVIAQDEATSVIWGMPGSAVASGVCSAVLPLDQIGPRIVRAFLGAKT